MDFSGASVARRMDGRSNVQFVVPCFFPHDREDSVEYKFTLKASCKVSTSSTTWRVRAASRTARCVRLDGHGQLVALT